MGLLDQFNGALSDDQFRSDVKRGLLDSVNRGVIGNSLGAPVDIVNSLLKPIGLSSKTPVMGSEWIGNKLQKFGAVSNNRNPVAESLAGFIDPATAGVGAMKAVGLIGTLGNSSKISRLISSQRYLDDARVAEKLANRDFTVKVSPQFDIGGEIFQTIQDGHHAYAAAKKAGVKPNLIVQTAQDNDRVNLLKNGKIDDFLGQSYVDSPWYYIDSGVDVW